MSKGSAFKQRVAIIDPSPRTREHARRAVRSLGHAPLVFEDANELLAAGSAGRPYAMMCFGLSAAMTEPRRLVDRIREVMGHDMPVMFVGADADPKVLKQLGRVRTNEWLATPSSFAELYISVEGFMVRHGLPLADDGLAWGSYRFYPACALARVGDTEVWLEPTEFELALEFFHNLDQPLTPRWLRSMVSAWPARNGATWLDNRVNRLRDQLDLRPDHQVAEPAARSAAYRLHSVATDTDVSDTFALERCEAA